ncbi:hypothetical protein QBC47DRAFT_399456 [Echria macrotheca]|uniref:Uncharacterized protein n=1 Tax=Echria macrotheca TaxID=438768 RepID=A0AAJ0BHU6_9PEZI|nr:hypothetical protein QBC47DRAFT_399456 [Echria macrotheca]
MDSSKLNTQELKPDQPKNDHPVKKLVDEAKTKFAPHTANPGPVIPQEFNVKEEGTKEERRAKAEELNK